VLIIRGRQLDTHRFIYTRSKNNFLFFSSNQSSLKKLRQCTIAISLVSNEIKLFIS
jgi:hypothetical protein